MNEIFLLKLGEIVLKGQNRKQFESKLRQNVRRRMKPYGEFDVYIIQSTVYVEPKSLDCDLEGAWEACHFIFGVVSLCRCRPCEKNLDRIFEAVEAYLGEDLECAQSFKVESKRSDKSFPMTSIQLSQFVGGELNEAFPHIPGNWGPVGGGSPPFAGGCAPSPVHGVCGGPGPGGLCPWTGGAGGGGLAHWRRRPGGGAPVRRH